jgi:hypothetical protein
MLSTLRLRIANWPWQARLALRVALVLLIGTPFTLYIADSMGWLYPGRRWIGVAGAFHCYAPKGMELQHVRGIDTIVLTSTSPTMRLTFDLDDRHARAATFAIHEYDRYPNYQQRTTHIAGRPAVLYTCEDPLERLGGRYVTGVSIPSLPRGRSLSGMMVSKFPDGRQAAVNTFATLTFP